MNAEELGNDFGYQCPKCKSGESLQIQVMRWADLLVGGTDDEPGDTEWDDVSPAQCSCGWEGKVKDLLEVELDEDEDDDEEEEGEAEDADPALS